MKRYPTTISARPQAPPAAIAFGRSPRANAQHITVLSGTVRLSATKSLLIALLAAPAICPAQSQQRTPAQALAAYTQPADNLLIIVADIQRHLNDDVYRFPYPQDVMGQNIFRAAIVQLANYEKLYPDRNEDIIAMARAQAYEKLCAFKEAGLNYEKAQETSDSAMKTLATKGFERTREFSDIVDRELDQSSLRSYEDAVKAQITDLGKLSDKYQGTPYQALALLSRERAQMSLAEFYSMFRFMKPYTTEMAVAQVKENLDKNNESKLRYTHRLMLANLNYELAREYTVLNDPEGPNFNLKAFDNFANTARADLAIIEQADGFSEKQEGRALLTALEAFIDRIHDRAR